MMQRHLGHLAILAALALALPVLPARADIGYPPAGPLILPDARTNLHLTHFTSPYDKGAVCDGTTDDSTALQAWLNSASATVGLTVPNATCAFATVLSLANPTGLFIQGAGRYQSTLLYTGAGTTADLLSLGAIGGAATNNISLSNFRIASNTTMTAGFALHLKNTQESVLRNIVTDGLLGNGKLWGGVWGDEVADIQTFGGSLYGQGDQLRVNGCLGAGCGPKAEFETVGTRIRGKGAASVGIHIGGAFGGFTCTGYTSIDMAGINFLADTAIVNESNREILLTDGCLVDVTDAGGTDGIQVNDAGPSGGGQQVSGGGYINIFGPVAGAVRDNINIIALKNGWLNIMNGPIGSAGTDNVRISDTTVNAIIGPHRNTSAGGYGINCTVSVPAGQIQTGGGINFSGNVSGNWGGTCNQQVRLVGTTTQTGGPLQIGGALGAATDIAQQLAVNFTSDSSTGVVFARQGVTNSQTLEFGINQASLYSEIQATHSGVTTDILALNRQGGPVGINMANPTAQLGLNGNLSFETNIANSQKGIFWKADADSSHGSIYRAISDGSLLIDAQANIKLGSVNANDVLIGTGTDCSQKLCVKGSTGLMGATSGTLSLKAPAAAGTNTITLPAGTTDFSATGGSSQVLKQTSAGGALTVAQLANTDITGLGTMSTQNASAVAITGGTAAGLTGLAIRDTSAAFDVTLAGTSSTALGAGRTLTLDMKNVAHTLAFNATANTITFPNTASYTLIGSGDSGTVTNTMLAGSIATSKLTALAHTASSVAAPTGTTSTTGLMMGLAGTITPTNSGTVHFSVCGDIANSTLADGANVQLRTGTGTAPSNGAALTGTTRGSLIKHTSPVAATKFPFCTQWTVTGLTLSTAVWIDVGLAAVTGGTASIADVDIVADEIP